MSASGRYSVSIETQQAAALGEEQQWLFDVRDRKGASPNIAAVDIRSGMPTHSHGLSVTPDWKTIDQKQISVQPIQFHMPGRWFFELRFRDENAWDSVRVEFEVDATGRISASSDDSTHAESMHNDSEDIEWTQKEKKIINSLALPLNGKGNNSSRSDDEQLIKLGKTLFNDRGLSGNGQISCRDCHDPDRYFTSDRITHATKQRTSPELQYSGVIKRDVMTIVGAASRPWLNWDGRKAELWSHALLPLEIDAEIDNNRTRIARYALEFYHEELASSLGELVVSQQPHWPMNAGPFGDTTEQANWTSLSANTKQQITGVFVSVGKALAAYQAQIKPEPGAFDYYANTLDDDDTPDDFLSLAAKRGLRLFIGDKARCINCHNNNTFTNHQFERVVPGNSMIDMGRSLGAQLYLYDEFNCRSRYSALSEAQCALTVSRAKTQISYSPPNAFMVPGLRGLKLTAPYMHDGRFSTLEDVISHYNAPGKRPEQGDLLPVPGSLSAQDENDLVAFLLSLGNTYSE